MNMNAMIPRWEHFDHDADIGIRGIAPTLAQAFEQAAIAMTAVITDHKRVLAAKMIRVCCKAADDELLFYDWINELIYAMDAHDLLFSNFQVTIDNGVLTAKVFGEVIDINKHTPAVEIKGATFTELRVYQNSDGTWVAQCVVDV
jgi:SHS2 domain-containing protein